MEHPSPSRRQFLVAIGNLASASWLTVNWPQIANAAEQAEHGGHGADGPAPTGDFIALTPDEAREVEAIANLIVPGGDTPGARDARVIHFIDTALGTFWADQLPSFREDLAEFHAGQEARYCSGANFSACSPALQNDWLHHVDETPFFLAVRRLTVLGLLALPKYGGNHDYQGWDLIGVENRHFWTAPFGYYDQDYPGFVPYPGTQPFTA